MAGLMSVTTTLYRDLFTVVKPMFEETFEAIALENGYPAYTSVFPVSGPKIHIPFGAGVGDMKEWLDERQLEKLQAFSWDITVKDWENTIAVTRNEIEDEQYPFIKSRIQELATSAATHPERRIADLINDHMDGTNTSFKNGFDGFALFNTAHVWPVGSYTTAQNNLRSGSNTGKMDDTYGLANIEGALTTLASFRGPRGRLMGLRGDTLVTAAGTAEWAARRILNSAEITRYARGTTDTEYAKASVNLLRGSLRHVVNPYLTAGYWFVCDTRRAWKPIIMADRQSLRWSELASDTSSERAFMRKEYLYGVDSRWECAPGYWFTCVGGDGT